MPDDLLGAGPLLEWALAGQQVIHRTAETVDVGTDIDPAIDDLLRCNVIAGADDIANLVLFDEGGRVFVEEACEAHVENFHGS